MQRSSESRWSWIPGIFAALLISMAAVIGETLAEIITGQIVGVDAGVTIQLIVTAGMYCAVLVGSISIIHHRTRLQHAKPS